MLPVPPSRNVGFPTLGLSLPSGHSQGPIAGDPLGSSHSEHPCGCSPAVLHGASAGALSRPSFGQERGQLHSSSPLGPRGLVFSRQDKEVSTDSPARAPRQLGARPPSTAWCPPGTAVGKHPSSTLQPRSRHPSPPRSQARPPMISKQSWSHSHFVQGSGERLRHHRILLTSPLSGGPKSGWLLQHTESMQRGRRCLPDSEDDTGGGHLAGAGDLDLGRRWSPPSCVPQACTSPSLGLSFLLWETMTTGPAAQRRESEKHPLGFLWSPEVSPLPRGPATPARPLRLGLAGPWPSSHFLIPETT